VERGRMGWVGDRTRFFSLLLQCWRGASATFAAIVACVSAVATLSTFISHIAVGVVALYLSDGWACASASTLSTFLGNG